MKNTSYDDKELIIKIPTDRKNDDVKELDQHIELAAKAHLRSAYLQMTNTSKVIQEEIARKVKYSRDI